MAEGSDRAHKILVIHFADRHQAFRFRSIGEATLDHRARLSRTETGTRIRPLRRARLARLSSSCHPLHCGLRVPGSRTEPFFPLRSRRPLGLTPSRNTAAILPSGLARFAWNGITPGRSLLCGKPLREFCSGNCRVVPFVGLLVYNIVVLSRRCQIASATAIRLEERYTSYVPEDDSRFPRRHQGECRCGEQFLEVCCDDG